MSTLKNTWFRKFRRHSAADKHGLAPLNVGLEDGCAADEALRVRVQNPIDVHHNVLSQLELKAVQEAADYASRHMTKALHFYKLEHLWAHALNEVPMDASGIWAEFGVFQAKSTNFFARCRPTQKIYGFDSFRGLQEDWKGSNISKGTFDLGGRLPSVERNVQLVQGWFDKTLPAFLKASDDDFSFIHVDCDTYEAAKTILDLAGPRITTGTVLIFDEYFGYRGWRQGEFKAWQEFVKKRKLKYGYLAFSYMQVSLRVL